MKKKMVALLVSSVAVGAFALGANASSTLEEISAYLNKGVKIKLNGSAWTPKDADGNVVYPITYDGTTYLPVRAAGEAIGLKVGWDNDTQTVLLGEEPSTVGSSRKAPADKGVEVALNVKNIMDDYSGSVKLIETVRGEAAWKMIKDENQFNQAAPDGYEYILAKLEVKISKNKSSDASVDINHTLFKAVSSDGRDYDVVMSVVTPSPEIDTKLYEGASNTGWAVFAIKKDDKAPLLAVGRGYDGTGGAWFKLQ